MTTAARIGKLSENQRKQAFLVGSQRARRGSISIGRTLEPRFLRHLAQQLVHLALQTIEIRHLLLAGMFAQRVHVDERGLGVFEGIFDLLEQTIDLREFVLDGDRLGNIHRLAAGEWILRRKLLDGVALAQAGDCAHEIVCERRGVGNAALNALDVGELAELQRGRKSRRDRFRNLDALDRIDISGVGQRLRARSLVLLEDPALFLLEHCLDRVETRTESADLRRIKPNRIGQFAIGELAPGAVHEHVLEHRIARFTAARTVGRRKLKRVVTKVGVDDPAEHARRIAGIVA